MANPWQDVICYPLGQRQSKPREKGLTMVMDKGMGLNKLQDLLAVAGQHLDLLKLGFGTSALYDEELLLAKLELCRQYKVRPYPGGTLTEIAFSQGKYETYLNRLLKLGFELIEISDGTIKLDRTDRISCIKKATSLGLTVLTEVGKKDPAQNPSLDELINLCQEDLQAGAWKVIIEARESGKNIGIYDKNGGILEEKLEQLSHRLIPVMSKIIWEAPLKEQQLALIQRFGSEVNLANIPPQELIPLEALRTGLRNDTLRMIANT
ncbi:MAG: phosphosulfolactate synthase [Peptococcia bacterium]